MQRMRVLTDQDGAIYRSKLYTPQSYRIHRPLSAVPISRLPRTDRYPRERLMFNRYAVRYGHRRLSMLVWLLPVVLLGGLLVAFTRGHSPVPIPANVIIAGTATANEPGPVLPADILGRLRSAGLGSTRATAYVVAPGASEPDTVTLTPHLASGQVDYGPTRIAMLNANVSAVQHAVEREAARGPFDLLATLAAAIKAAPPPATLIVVSSGLSTSGGFDLRQVGWDASPASVAAQLKARGLLPDLAGYQVMFVGLGDTAGRQPALPLPQQTALASYWRAICQASGAASCGMDDTARPEPASSSTIPVPPVPAPVVTSVRGPGNSSVTSLPATLLFSFGSSRLVPSADTLLRPLAQRARRQHLLVSITGFASPDGGGDNASNRALATNRAITVRNRMVALGLPVDQIARVAGGGTSGQGPGVCVVHGHLDEAICARLRRVVIVMSPAGVSS